MMRFARLGVHFYVRLLVSAVLLALLLPQIDLRSLMPREADLTTLIYAFGTLAITGIGLVLSAWRWQRVLMVLERPEPLGDLVTHHLAGQFVGNVLPSTIGGDLLRVHRLTVATGSAETSFASILIERLTGWLILPLFTLTAMAVHPSLLGLGLASRLAVALAGGTLVMLCLLVLVAGSRRIGGRFAGRDGLVRFIDAAHLGIRRFRQHRAATAAILVAAAVYQLSTVVVLYCATHALGVEVSLAWAFAFAPAVAVAQVLPVSINGLGLREGALVIFLTPLGVAPTEAVAVGLLIHVATIVISLLGAPAFALGPRARMQTV
jgi:uncharacterized protein (TIRG00374 family)